MAQAHPCDPSSARQKSRQPRPIVSEHRVDLQFGVSRASRPQGRDLLAYHDGMIKYDYTKVREALRDWKTKRTLQLQELAALKAEIDKGSPISPKAA